MDPLDGTIYATDPVMNMVAVITEATRKSANTVAVIRGQTNMVVATVPVGGDAAGIASMS